jgi:hypothetical protein
MMFSKLSNAGELQKKVIDVRQGLIIATGIVGDIAKKTNNYEIIDNYIFLLYGICDV